MYPHRDFSRNKSTIRALPIAIKSSEDNSWTSVLVNHLDENPTHECPDADPFADLATPSAPNSDFLCVHPQPPVKSRCTIFKEKCAFLVSTKWLTFIFHLSNMLHYFLVPYLLVFWHQLPWMFYLVYYFGMINDVIFFIYVSIACRKGRRCWEWVYNLFLVVPFWFLYEEITRRLDAAWRLDGAEGIDAGFFICRSVTAPLRLYWTVKPLQILRPGDFSAIKFTLRLGVIMVVLLHAGAVMWGLMVRAFRPVYRTNLDPRNARSFQDSYPMCVYYSAGIMFQCAWPGPIETWPNAFVIVISFVYFMFFLFLHGFLFLDREVHNKRHVALQHFTRTLKKHLAHSDLKRLVPHVTQNHENVEVNKKSISLDQVSSFLRDVNWALVQDVLFDLNLPALKAGVILGVKHASSECFLRYLSTKMRREFYNANETIFRLGTRVDKMVVLMEGYVDVLAEDNRTSMMSLEAGSCLGQTAMLLKMSCKATIKCVTHVQVLSLTKKDFLTLTLNAFPDVYKQIMRAFQVQLTDSRVRNSTMMKRPPQYGVSIAEKANKQLYRVCTISNSVTRKGSIAFYKPSGVGKVDHNLVLNAAWNLMMVIISVIVAVFYPYYVAFQRRFPDTFQYVAIAMEALIVVDLILTLITYNIPRSKQRVFTWNRSAWKKHLWKKLSDWSFYLDFFSALCPEVLVYALPASQDPEQTIFLYYVLKLNRILKVYKLFHLMWSINCSNEFYKRLFIHTLSIALVVYYGGVLLYLAACFTLTCYPDGWHRTLRSYEFRLGIKQPRTDHPLLCSLHESLQNVHNLEMNISTNTLDMSICLLISFLGYAYLSFVFVDLANLRFLQLRQNILYRRDIHDIKKFCLRNRLPETLRKRLLAYYRIQWKHVPGYLYQYNHGNYMSATLHNEILLAERFDTLTKVPFLNAIGSTFCAFLALKSKIYLIPARDYVTYIGSMNKEMLVLARGFCRDESGMYVYPLHRVPPLMNIHTQTESEDRSGADNDDAPGGASDMKKGAFGMASLLFNLPEGHTISTCTPCVFVSIDGSALQEALLHYPQLNNALSKVPRSKTYATASGYNFRVAEEVGVDARRMGMLQRVGRFFQRVSFINVLKYCSKRGESYGYPFRTEEIAFLRFFMAPFTVHPWGVFFLCWVVLRAVVALAHGLTTPLTLISYGYYFQGPSALFYANVFCDVVLSLDCLLLCYLAYEHYNGILVVHPYRTIRRYGGRGMLIDCMLALPLEWIYRAYHDDLRTYAVLRMIKMIQVYKFFVLLAKLKLLELHMLPRTIEVIKCASMIGILVNAGACALVASECVPLEGETDLFCAEGSWVRRSAMWRDGRIAWRANGDAAPLQQIYLLAIYWTSCLLFSVDFGYLRTQGGANLHIVVCILIVGIFLRGYMLKTVISYFVGTLKHFKDSSRVVEYQKMMKQLRVFLADEEAVDKGMEERFRESALYYWRMNRGVDKTSLLSRLHTTLLQDTLCFLYEDVLSQVPLFAKMERAFIRILVLIAKPVYLLPRQVIIRHEDVCDRFYIVLEGVVHIELARSSYQVNISKGSIFGHFSKDTTPLMSIIATTVDYVHVLAFKSIDYFNILKNYSKFDIELKSVLSEYKDFMPNHTRSDDSLQFSNIEDKPNAQEKEKGKKRRGGLSDGIITDGSKRILRFYKHFDTVITMFAFINCVLIAVNFLTDFWFVMYLMIAIDVVFVLALALQHARPFYNNVGCLITSYQLTREENLRGKLGAFVVIEVICSIVLVFSYFMYNFPAEPVALSSPRMCFAYLRLVAFYRCRYIGNTTFKDVDDTLWLPKLLRVVATLLVTLHCTTCLWLFCDEYVGKMAPSDYGAIMERYEMALLLMINLLTGGATIRHIYVEEWQQVVISLLLPTFNLYRYFLIAKMTTCLYLKVRSVVTFNYQLKQLMAYVQTMRVNSYQAGHLRRHMVQVEKKLMGKNFPSLLSVLPAPLTNELKVLLYRPLLEKSYVFYGTQSNFLCNVAVQLRRSVYFEAEIIVHRGEINRSMYFIRKGNVEIVTINEDYTETRHDHLGSGEMFGLAQGLFRHNVPHQFTFKAVTDVEILTLRLDHWEHLLRHFPRSKDTIYNRIRNAQVFN